MFFKLYISFVVVVHEAFQQSVRYEFCAQNCQNFRISRMSCREANKLDCILKVNNGTACFTTVTYENALLTGGFLNDLEVVANFRPDRGDSFDEDGVIVVRKNLINGLKGLQGFKYCAPRGDALRYVSRDFQNTVLRNYDIDICNAPGESIFEKKLRSLSNLFGSSCLPGQWVENVEYDTFLKQKYAKVLELCEKPSYTKNENDPSVQSFDCFLNGDGDIAVTNYTTVQNYINSDHETSQYRYLCPSDFVEMWGEGSCSWKRQETLLIANRVTSSSLSKNLKIWFKDYLLNPKQAGLDSRNVISLMPNDSRKLKNVLFPSKSKINVINVKSLKNYLKGAPSLNENKLCNLDVKWCTISNDEQEKCNWLARAAAIDDIKPDIVCVQENNSSACLQAVRTGTVDVAKVDTKIYPELPEYLDVLKYPIVNNVNYEYIIIIKSGFSESDMKGKGCYSGIGHTNSTLPIKYDTSTSEALECFHQVGNFAVLERNDSLKLNATYTLLCENGDEVQFSEDVMNTCTWTIPVSALVTQKRNPKIKDIEILLSEFVERFAEHEQSAFRLFEDFRGKRDLLFLDHTVSLSDPRNDVHPTVRTYNKLLRYLNFSNHQANLYSPRFAILFSLVYLLYLF